jgi:hypothetical protein
MNLIIEGSSPGFLKNLPKLLLYHVLFFLTTRYAPGVSPEMSSATQAKGKAGPQRAIESH